MKIFIFILKSKLPHLKLTFKVGSSGSENNNFPVFFPFVEDSDKLVYCAFLWPFRFVTTISKIPLPLIETLLSNFLT